MDWLIRQYYKIPKIRLQNPFRIIKRDKREFAWYKERRQFGFDQRSMWNLGPELEESIKMQMYGHIDKNIVISQQEFLEWFKNNPSEVDRLYSKVSAYIHFKCPVFIPDVDNGYLPLPDAEVNDIMANIYTYLYSGHADDTEIRYIYKYIFYLGY